MTDEPTGSTIPMGAPMAIEPVRFDVEYAESLSRLLIFVKWLLVIPHLFILYVLGLVAYVVTIIAFFSILFTRKFPPGMHAFVVGVYRWNANVYAYYLLLRDEYPPFSWETGLYPVTFEIDHPETMNRWAPLYKWLLVLPNALALLVVMLVASFLVIVGWFAILITGKMPRDIHEFVAGTMRWYARTMAYAYLLRDEYPPFSMK